MQALGESARRVPSGASAQATSRRGASRPVVLNGPRSLRNQPASQRRRSIKGRSRRIVVSVGRWSAPSARGLRRAAKPQLKALARTKPSAQKLRRASVPSYMTSRKPPVLANAPSLLPPARRERPRKRAETRDFGGDDSPRERPRRGGDEDVETYRIEVGHDHGVKPGNIVGAIANEVGLEGRLIGRVVIQDDHSFVDLPTGMPKEVFLQLQKVRVAGQPLQISRALKSHVEKLRRERPSAPKFRKQNDSRARRPKLAARAIASDAADPSGVHLLRKLQKACKYRLKRIRPSSR